MNKESVPVTHPSGSAWVEAVPGCWGRTWSSLLWSVTKKILLNKGKMGECHIAIAMSLTWPRDVQLWPISKLCSRSSITSPSTSWYMTSCWYYAQNQLVGSQLRKWVMFPFYWNWHIHLQYVWSVVESISLVSGWEKKQSIFSEEKILFWFCKNSPTRQRSD